MLTYSGSHLTQDMIAEETDHGVLLGTWQCGLDNVRATISSRYLPVLSTRIDVALCACVQAVKRRGKALGWLAALLAMYPGGPLLKPKGGGGLAAIARQRKLPVRPGIIVEFRDCIHCTSPQTAAGPRDKGLTSW